MAGSRAASITQPSAVGVALYLELSGSGLRPGSWTLIVRAGAGGARGHPGPGWDGEQTLLARLVRRRPELFAGLVICLDRNFPVKCQISNTPSSRSA